MAAFKKDDYHTCLVFLFSHYEVIPDPRLEEYGTV